LAIKPTSEKFRRCRKRVNDHASEAQMTLHMVTPFLSNDLEALKLDYLRASGLFLRRSLTRYLALALYRLLDKPNDSGRTGVTASISSLLEMAKSEDVLSGEQYQNLTSDIEQIKTSAAEGEYDLVGALRDLRNIQVAHSLIPWEDPTDHVYGHHLVEFAQAIFDFVVRLEEALTEATGVEQNDLRQSADAFETKAVQFWRALASLK
jgi:AbiU2